MVLWESANALPLYMVTLVGYQMEEAGRALRGHIPILCMGKLRSQWVVQKLEELLELWMLYH